MARALIILGILTSGARAELINDLVWKERFANDCIEHGHCNRAPRYHQLHAVPVIRSFLLEFPESQRLLIADMLLRGRSVLELSGLKKWLQSGTNIGATGLIRITHRGSKP